MIDPDHQGEIGLHNFYFHYTMEVRKNMAGIQEITNLFSSIASLVIKLMENCINPTKVRLLMAQTLQELTFRSPQQAKSHGHLMYWNDSRNVVINISYNLVTSCRNENCNIFNHLFLILLECVCI